MILDLQGPRDVNPLWWRGTVWVVMIVASILVTRGTDHRILGGVLLGVGAAAFQLLQTRRPALRRTAVLTGIVLGHAACYAMPNGFAYILPLVAISRAPRAFEGRWLLTVTGLTSVAFATTVADITGSPTGLLAGLAVPMLVQRSLESQVVIRERDRAQALLTEVQAGREAETTAAALRERGRIAREMHDVLAHSLAGLSVQLQAVRALAARAGTDAAVMEQLDKAAQLAREGVAEARATVSTLRDPVGLSVDDVPALVERHPGRAALAVHGDPGRVSPEAGHAVYRGIQETLTNAARYAPGSDVAVLLEWSAATLVVTVTDDGPPPGRAAVAGQGTGLGLAGMTERVSEAGGSVTSGPREGGGWRTRIEVPTQQEAA